MKYSFKEIDRKHKFDTSHKIYCTNCGDGHGVVFYNTGKDRLLCPNCKKWIYKDKKAELKYKMKERGVRIA